MPTGIELFGEDRQKNTGDCSRPAGVPIYFEEGGVTIVNADDSLEILPLLADDIAAAVVTDPPYCSGGRSTGERAADPVEKYCQNNNAQGRPTFEGDHLDQRSFAFWTTMWLRLMRRVVRPNGYCLVFSDWRQLPTLTDAFQAGGFTWRGVVPWNKGRGSRAPHKGYFRHQCEYVVWGTRGACRRRTDAGPFDGCVSESVRRADKFHITGKPTPLMRQLVRVAPAGELVIDPFGGSGTTAVASVQTGRRCLLIERSEEYCEIAANRVREALAAEPRQAA